MRLPSLCILLALACAPACKSATAPTGFGVDLTIDGRKLTQRAGVTSVSITTSGAETYARTLTTDDVQKSGIVRTRYVPGVLSGALVFTVDALDKNGTIVGLVSMPVTLLEKKAAQVTLVLVDPMVAPPDGGMPVDMLPSTCGNGSLDPGETDVDCGGTQCPGCEPDKACKVDDDCATGSCVALHCELATGPPSWVAVTNLPAPRQGAAAGSVGSRLYIAGGQTATDVSAGAIETSTLAFDLQTNAWTGVAAGLTTPREAFAMVATPGQLIAAGGVDSMVVMAQSSTASIEAFTVTPAWAAQQRTLGVARSSLGAALGSDNLVYVFGGTPYPAVGVLATVESFNPAVDGAGAATPEPGLPSARSGLAGAPDAKGHVLALGGIGADNTVASEVDILDPSVTPHAWTTAAPLTVARGNLGAALGPDGRVYAVGGQNGAGGALADVEALAQGADHWTPVVSLPTARTLLSVAQGPDGRIYAIGGKTVNMADNSVQAYGPRIQPGPATGAPGTVIALSCSNFAANANVTVTFSGDTPGTIAVSGKTTALGAVSPSLVWKVPAVASGTYTLTAVDDRARFPVRSTFVVP